MLDIDNFKNIKKKKVEIGGRSFVITGGNGAGKSTIMQVLQSAVDSKFIPLEPITQGEERGSTEVSVAGELNGETVSYKITNYFTPANQKGRLVVENKDSEVLKSPRKLLDSILGDISFDIEKFLKDPASKQVATLKQLSGKAKELDLIEMDIAKAKDKVKYLKENNKEQETLLKNHGYSQQELELYSKPILVDPIKEELKKIGPDMEEWSRVSTGVDTFTKAVEATPGLIQKEKDSITKCDAEKKRLQLEIDRLRGEIIKQDEAIVIHNSAINNLTKVSTENLTKIEKGNTWLEKHPKPDAEGIGKKLSDAEAHNVHFETIKEYQLKQSGLMKGKEELITQEELIKKLLSKREQEIANSNIPIKGLTFSEEGVFMNNLPFDSTQVNTQTRIEVGKEISILLNPNLRVVFVPEGSLFDKKLLYHFVSDLEKRGYQVIVEIVDPAGGPLEIIYMEDYFIEK